jgi:hypothetical protein
MAWHPEFGKLIFIVVTGTLINQPDPSQDTTSTNNNDGGAGRGTETVKQRQ